jgi:pyruvyl transferase EpsI
LSNIGDHAQVIAIRQWLSKHFPEIPILEINKEEVLSAKSVLRKNIKIDDIIFLHSGGNLGDRGVLSEVGRRWMIDTFTANRIISLPQTVFFSDTERGIEEKELSSRIYNHHPNLTIIGRDPISAEIAGGLFENATILCIPDFVLSLDVPQSRDPEGPILLCFRRDIESVISEDDLLEITRSLDRPVNHFDTTFNYPIHQGDQARLLNETLEYFSMHSAVVTDRFHGLIFSVILGLPVVALRTVDHKIVSGMSWFEGLPFVKIAGSIREVPQKIDECREIEDFEQPDWSALYFNRLPVMLGLVESTYAGDSAL